MLATQPEGFEALREKAQRVHELLLAHYGQPHPKEQRDPLDELILTILSQNTADVNTSRSYASLRKRFATWEDALAATDEEVARAICIGGLAHIKAPRIRRILAHLRKERGRLSLDFLAQMPVSEARGYLLALEGVGPKTAACVLLFSLHLPALPVDTHVYRVTRRIGLVPAKATPERTQALLEELLPPDLYYPFHLNVIRHGRTLCRASRPRCDICPVAELCDYAASAAAVSTGQETRAAAEGTGLSC